MTLLYLLTTRMISDNGGDSALCSKRGVVRHDSFAHHRQSVRPSPATAS